MPPQNNFGMIPDFGMQNPFLGIDKSSPMPIPEGIEPYQPMQNQQLEDDISRDRQRGPDPFTHRMPQEFEGSRGFVDTFNTLGGMPTYAGLPDSTYLDYTDPINQSPASGGPGITGEFDNYAPDDMDPWSPEDAAWWGDPEDQSIQQIKGPVGRETDERYGRVTPEGIVPLRDTPGGVANEDRGNPFLTAQGVVDPATGQRRVSTPVGQPISQPNEEVGFMDREISDHGQKMRNVMDAYYGGADFGYETEWAEGLGVAQKDIDNFMAALNSGDIDYAMQNPTDFVLEEFERKWGWPLNVNSSSYRGDNG
jgi:hypothetical protein